MTKIADDFIAKFHSLDGITVAQRRKNFFILLHENSSLKGNTEALNAITSNLQPKTYLESLFKLEFLIYFRRTQELYQQLKEGNDVFVSKIVKQIWFFKEFFNEVGADELVNEILPCMSFSVRMKVLRKLSQYLDPEQFDKIFDAVAARYGIFNAMKFITGCTPTKIRQILVDHRVDLTKVQLKIIYKKDPSFIEFYFENSEFSFDLYKSIFKFLYIENRTLYDHLQEKYDIEINFGRRLTKKIVDVKRDAIIKKPMDFTFLDMKAVIRKIGKDSVQLFCNILPPTIDKLDEIVRFMKHFPKKYHYSLYVKAVENHYNTKFIAHPKLIDNRLLNLIPDNSERATLARVRVDKGDDDYIKYLTTQESISLIKEKINVTSNIHVRGELVRLLIETCHINNDINALAEVMKYFYSRHKNDDINVHMQFIQNIENLFGFKKFTEEMWNYLNDLLTIHMLKFDENLSTYQKIQTLPLVKFNRGTSTHQKLSYLEFLFNKNEPIDELMSEFLDTKVEWDNWTQFPKWGSYSKEFEKYFLLFVLSVNSKKSLETGQIEDNCTCISQIIMWNRCYKDDPISFYDFPSLVHSFNYSVKEYGYIDTNTKNILRNKIFTTIENSYRDDYLKVYWNRIDQFKIFKDFQWFLKHDPIILVNNLYKFIDKVIEIKPMSDQVKIWHTIKKYSHLQLDDMSLEYCISKQSDEALTKKKSNFVTCLSVLMKPENYVAFADSCKPSNKALDLQNETEVRLYDLQRSIAQNFKNTKSHEVLPSLLNYCAGDYFKYSIRSLYSILCHTPENMLPQHLDYLAEKAVSVRKHALYLTCELTTLARIEGMVKSLNETEKVQSLQKYLFSSTVKCFVKNPSDNLFDLVKWNMLHIVDIDDESHRFITEKIPQIPTKYRAAYIQYSWEYLKKILDGWQKLFPLIEGILRKMNKEIMLELPLEFGLTILNELLVEENCIGLQDMSSFAFWFLFFREEKTIILDTVLKIIDERASGPIAFDFFHRWYHYIMSSDDNLKYIEPYVKYFENQINIIHNFLDYVKIFFLKTKLELPQDDFNDDLCDRIFSFLEELTSTYGPFIIEVFAVGFSAAIPYFVDRDVFCHNMIKKHPVPNVAMLILNVLSKPREENGESFKLFKQILKQIEKIPDRAIQINLRHKFDDDLADDTYKEVDH